MMKKEIVCWFSCGVASAIAAYKTLEKYASVANIRIVNTPIKEEHEDNLRFKADIERWLGVEIEIASNLDYPSNSCVDVWQQKRFMSSIYGASCTTELKKKARQQWEKIITTI